MHKTIVHRVLVIPAEERIGIKNVKTERPTLMVRILLYAKWMIFQGQKSLTMAEIHPKNCIKFYKQNN